MKKTKIQKGITLIALIITIIVLLILAVVAIGSVQDSDIITYAKRAAAATDMAKIKEEAEIIKLEMLLGEKTDKNIVTSKQEYINKLLEKFPGSERKADKVVVNGKYDIIIKNSNFDIEVKEHSDVVNASELMEFSYTIVPVLQENEKTYMVEIIFNAEPIMTSSEYQTLMESQEVKEEVSPEKMKEEVLANLSEESGQTITELDQFTLYFLNTVVSTQLGETTHPTIDEWLEDEDFLNKLQIESFTKGQLNAALYAESQVESLTNDEAIEYYYNNNLVTATDYTSEYYKNTNNLSLYNDKGESINLYTNYSISENGVYEFILKNSYGEVVGFEKITINYLQPGDKLIITSQEEMSKWTTNGKGAVTGYLGDETEVIIPMYIGREKITSTLSTFAFNNKIEKVIITDSITSIGTYTFQCCENLKEIEISEKTTSIGICAFVKCESLSQIIIPDSVTKIDNEAFKGCKMLKDVKLSKSLNLIDSRIFSGCSSLEEIIIPNSVTTISTLAFEDCTSLKKIGLPNSLSKIGTSAFNGCTLLESITIPNSVNSIDSEAFEDCTNLSSIYFAPGDNSIPNATYAPWGAPKGLKSEGNPNGVHIEKLTE